MKDTDRPQKIKIIALFGKSGSGKDTILNKIMTHYGRCCHKIVSCTTRPKRDCEKDQEDYYFISEAQFADLLLKNLLLEGTFFNGWFYGTQFSALNKDKINVGVFNISGIYSLLDNDNLDVIPVLITASDKTRLIRCLNREQDPNCKEIVRRFQQDEKDFDDIDFHYQTYSTETEKKDEPYWYPLLFQHIICKWETVDKID